VEVGKQMPTNKSILKIHFQNVAHIAFVVPRCIQRRDAALLRLILTR
jgi:hypothetical protein